MMFHHEYTINCQEIPSQSSRISTPQVVKGMLKFVTLPSHSVCHLELRRVISQIVEDDPSIPDRALSMQLRKLIVDPCRRNLPGDRTFVVAIDGLDECEGQDVQPKILCSIGTALHEEPSGSSVLKFFITSRPKSRIHDIFSGTLCEFHLAVNIEPAFDEVRRYLLAEFARITS
jgi:hypothetical protein